MPAANVKGNHQNKILLLWIAVYLWWGAALVTSSADIWVNRAIPGRCGNPSVETSLSSLSVIMCAFRARQYGAAMFGYNNTACDLYEDQNQMTQSPMEFRKVPSLDLLEETAAGKNTFASPSSSSSYSKELAVDESKTSYYCSYSSADDTQFWIVDLGNATDVHLVTITGRYATDIEIRLGMDLQTSGDFSSYTLFATFEGPSQDKEEFFCYSAGVRGRYLSIQKVLPTSDYLRFYDVGVYASKP